MNDGTSGGKNKSSGPKKLWENFGFVDEDHYNLFMATMSAPGGMGFAGGYGLGSSPGFGFGYRFDGGTPGFGTGPKSHFAGTAPFPDVSSFYEQMFETGKMVENFENHCNLVLEKYSEEKSQVKSDIRSIVDRAKETIAAISPFGNKTFDKKKK
jgi:hypothetical protein